MRKLRISAISFLNTAPLMWDFEHGVPPQGIGLNTGPQLQRTAHAEAASSTAIATVESRLSPDLARDFEVEYTIPSQCAEALRAGTADVGIIPVAAYATVPDLVILPDVAIAAKGPVRSILLVSRLPLEQVRTLAADTSSRTSVALTRVLFDQWFGRIPEFTPAAPVLETMLAHCDAALLIGDPALQVDRTRYRTWDLAQEWQQLTGKPFVFAFWAVRLQALSEMRRELDLARVFQNSRDRGLEPENLAVIAQEWASRVKLRPGDAVEYLTRNVHYWLDEENLAGMDLFFRWAAACGAIPEAPPLRFLGTPAASLKVL